MSEDNDTCIAAQDRLSLTMGDNAFSVSVWPSLACKHHLFVELNEEQRITT